MTCVCFGPAGRLYRWGRHVFGYRAAQTSRDATHATGPRVQHLKPTVFVDAIPELAAERRRRQEAARVLLAS